MRFLFKIIVLPIILLIAIPVGVAGLMYKNVDIPVEEYSGGTAIEVDQMLQDEMDAFLLNSSRTSELKFEVSQATANQLIKNAFEEMNPNYLNPDATEDERNYVLKEDMFGYQGSWVRFKKGNIIEIESGVHAFVGGFTYKTRLLLAFKLDIDTEEIVLTLNKVTIGNLPIAWAMSAASWLAEKVMGKSLEDLIGDQLEGFGTFDPVKRTATIKVDKLLDTFLDEEDGNKPLIDALLQFVKENELIDIGFDDEVFSIKAAVGKIYDGEETFKLKTEDKIINDEHMQTILMSKASSVVLSSLSSGNPYLKVDDLTLNRILEYYLRPNLTIDGYIMKTDLMEEYQALIGVPYVTIGTDILVNIPIEILSKLDANKHFQSIIKIHATPDIVGHDLYFHLSTVEAGELLLTEENIGLILGLLGENELIVDGALVLKDFDQMMASSGIDIQSVAVKDLHLFLYIKLNLFEDLGQVETLAQAALDLFNNNPNLPPELGDSIQNVLDNLNNPDTIDGFVNEMIGEMVGAAVGLVSDNENISPEVTEALTDVIDNMSDPVAVEAAIDHVVEIIQNLSDEEQEELFDALAEALGDTGLSYEDLLGLFS